MSIAIIVAAAALAAAPAAAVPKAMPPIVVDLSTPTAASTALVSNVIDETQAIFRSTGIRFLWRRNGSSPLGALRVVIDDDTGPRREGTPLGWLVFENNEPTREIHLSYDNAVRFMEGSREVVGYSGNKTRSERDLLIGRALGRALAHELGHYLLATKTHTPKGLLKGSRTAQEFFAPDRSGFTLDALERRLVAARVQKEFELVRRQN